MSSLNPESSSFKSQNGTEKITKDLQLLFTEFNSLEYLSRLTSFKSKIPLIVENSEIEGQVIQQSEKFGEVYGLLQVTCEILYSFSLFFKKAKNISKALAYSEKCLSFSESYKSLKETMPKYLMHLASLYASLKFHDKSLSLLKKSELQLKAIIRSSDKAELHEMLIINLHNIATEQESLKNYTEAEKYYRESYELCLISSSVSAQKLLDKNSDGMNRMSHFTSLKTANLKYEFKRNAVKGSPTKKIYGSLEINKKPRPHSGRKDSSSLRAINKIEDSIKSAGREIRIISKRVRKNNSSKNRNLDSFLEPTLVRRFNVSKGESYSFNTKTPDLDNQRYTMSESRPKDPILAISNTNNMSFEPTTAQKDSGTSRSSIDFNRDSGSNVMSLAKLLNIKSEEMRSEEPGEDSPFSQNERDSQMNTKVEKNCLLKENLDFELDLLEVIYQLSDDLKYLKVLCQSRNEKLSLEVEVPSNIPVLQFIETTVRPGLSISNDSLMIFEKEEILLVKGFIENDLNSSNISILRIFPRWKIRVIMDSTASEFELSEILKNFRKQIDASKDSKFLMSLFCKENKSIRIKYPLSYYPKLIYEEVFLFPTVDKDVLISVYQIDYLDGFSFFIEGNNKRNKINPLIIDSLTLCKLCNKLKLTLDKIISYLKKAINIDKDFQIFIDKSKPNFISLTTSASIIEKQQSLLSYPSFDKEKLEPKKCKCKDTSHKKKKSPEASIRSSLSSLASIIPEPGQLMSKGFNLTREDYGDRIILRLSVYKFDQIFQVFMKSPSQEKITFYIKSGIDSSKVQKTCLSMDTISEKLGVEKEKVISLGAFIVRNLLIFKSPEIIYFDLTLPVPSPVGAVNKISALCRGFLIRKKLKINLSNPLGKRRIRLKGNIYTALVYVSNDILYLRLVKMPEERNTEDGSEMTYGSVEVLGLNMKFKHIANDGYFSSLDKFFISFNDLGITLNQSKRVKYLTCKARYMSCR